MQARVLATAMTATALIACGGGEDTGAGDEAGCVSDRLFFQETISLPILEEDCATCHNAQGLARQTNLVLLSAGETNALQTNFETLREVAELEKDGTSILLLKPTEGIAHGGGQRFAPDSDQYQAFEALLERFENPVECEGEMPGGEMLDKVVLLDLPGVLRKAKVQLIGELPSPEEIDAVAEGGPGKLDELLLGYLAEDAFYVTLQRWYNDRLLTDKYLHGDNATNLLDAEQYPDRRYYSDLDRDTPEGQKHRQYANRSVAREPLELISHVVRNDRPFTEILTADYMLLNPFSARVYGAEVSFDDALDPTEFREVKLPGVPHAGVLTSPMYLNRFPTTATNRNRHRSRMTYQLFLATDILKKAEQPVDPTLIQDHNPTMNNPQCTVCHATVDPLAGSFLNWDERGRYVPPEAWFQDMRPPGFGEAVLPSGERGAALQWAAKRLVEDERFALAAVYAVYIGLVGRPPLENPTDDTDPRFSSKLAFYNLEQEFLRETTDKFVASGYNLKTIVPEIVRSVFYRAVSANGLTEDEAAVLEPLGTTRLLTPEELDRKLNATLGFPWKRRSPDNNLLTNTREFFYFYGGIDSDQVTERITEPNGMMANIQLRMASELGCISTPRDFYRPPEERVLFPDVERSYTPEDDNGFEVPQAVEAIKRNIRYLHHRILGEVILPGSEQEAATYDLFLQTWREGYQAFKNGQAPRDVPSVCRYVRDWETNTDLPEEERLYQDPLYTMRAWSAVLTYLLADWRFLYHH